MQLGFVGEEELPTGDLSQLAPRLQCRANHVRHAQQQKWRPCQHSGRGGKIGTFCR